VLFNVAGLVVLAASGHDDPDRAPIWVLFVGTLAGWTVFVGAMVVVSHRAGTGRFVHDYRVRFRPLDVLATGAGALTQVAAIPLLYLPLEALWPDTFSSDKLSENAKDLVDRATGASLVLLVVMVCVGAPIVEELVYRGLVQGSLADRFPPVAAWLIASALFAVIHFRPVEYPGLFLAGLVFGAGALLAGRLGPAVAAHLGFNVAGLILAFG